MRNYNKDLSLQEQFACRALTIINCGITKEMAACKSTVFFPFQIQLN